MLLLSVLGWLWAHRDVQDVTRYRRWTAEQGKGQTASPVVPEMYLLAMSIPQMQNRLRQKFF